MEKLTKEYWDNRYHNEDTGWDIGSPSTPIIKYVDQLLDKKIKILIPGCGNAYEAEYLWKQGFQNVHLLDFSRTALAAFKIRVPDFPESNLIEKDFFHHNGCYDLIIEQTFFCAINPNLRADYAQQMQRLLVEGGKLVGLLFNDDLNQQAPPFGGNKEEYVTYFQPHFNEINMEVCYNSIAPRQGRELFIKLIK